MAAILPALKIADVFSMGASMICFSWSRSSTSVPLYQGCLKKQSAIHLNVKSGVIFICLSALRHLNLLLKRHGLALFLYIEVGQGVIKQCSAILAYSDEDAVVMQAAQANNNSYGGHSYPHTDEHQRMMDRGWPDHRIGQLYALSSSCRACKLS